MKDKLTLPAIELGIYEHYKGKRYEVVGVAMDEAELIPVVIYKPLYESSVKLWARKYDVFIGTVALDGARVQRFAKVESNER